MQATKPVVKVWNSEIYSFPFDLLMNHCKVCNLLDKNKLVGFCLVQREHFAQ